MKGKWYLGKKITFISVSLKVFICSIPKTCLLCISSGKPSSSGGGNGRLANGGASTNN